MKIEGYNGKTSHSNVHTPAAQLFFFVGIWPSPCISSDWTTVHRTTACASKILKGPCALGEASTGDSYTEGNPKNLSTHWQAIHFLHCKRLE